MYEQLLVESGLSYSQAVVYEVLLRDGEMTAGSIDKKTPLKRGLVYKVLEQLISLKLVAKKDAPGMVSKFTARHPERLLELANQRAEKAYTIKGAVSEVMPQLISEYGLGQGRPAIQYFEGIEGLKLIYGKILDRKKPLSIFASIHDRENQELNKIINRSVAKQKAAGIRVRALIPVFAELDRSYLSYSEEMGIENRVLPPGIFKLEAQIMVFDNIVVLTALKDSVISTVVENSNIAQAQQGVFDALWELSGPGHEKIVSDISDMPRQDFADKYLE